MADPKNLFWDSCVFIAYFEENANYDVESIEQYLEEAKEGKWLIHMSTVSLAEIRPSHMRKKGKSFTSFIDDFEGSIITVSPSTNIMLMAGRLRDLPYRRGEGKNRILSTPDAIILATCASLVAETPLRFDALHSFDKRGSKDHDEERKTVPIIGYEKWCEGFLPEHYALAHRVINLSRCEPTHSSPRLIRADGTPANLLPPVSRSNGHG